MSKPDHPPPDDCPIELTEAGFRQLVALGEVRYRLAVGDGQRINLTISSAPGIDWETIIKSMLKLSTH